MRILTFSLWGIAALFAGAAILVPAGWQEISKGNWIWGSGWPITVVHLSVNESSIVAVFLLGNDRPIYHRQSVVAQDQQGKP